VLDIHPNKGTSAQFLPLVAQTSFWVAQMVPLGVLALLGFGIWFRQTRVTSLPARALRQEKRSLWRKVNASKDRSEVLNAAVRLLELKTPVSSGNRRFYGSIEEILARADLPSDLRGSLQELVHTRAEAVYGHVGEASLSESERNRIRSLVQQWEAV
jgi:hypothetical protein